MSPIGINLEPLPPFSPLAVDVDGYERLPASNAEAPGDQQSSVMHGADPAGERTPSRPPLEAPARPPPQTRSPSQARRPAAGDVPDAEPHEEAAPWSQSLVPRAVTTAMVGVESAAGSLDVAGGERAPPAHAESTLALATPLAMEVERRIVCVALHFGGRKKMVRHLESTYVGQLPELHLGNQKREPVVVTDREGFEVGKELTLGIIARTVGECDGILELTMKIDEW